MWINISGQKLIYKYSSLWRAGDLKQMKSNRMKLGRALKKTLVCESTLTYSSISHTKHLGGFAACARPIGFDLEYARRQISPRAVRWFASPSEIKKAADPLHIWVMKEAAFKATRGPQQPQTINQIKIKALKVSQNKTWKFQFEVKGQLKRHGLGGVGLLKINSRTIMGIAVLLP